MGLLHFFFGNDYDYSNETRGKEGEGPTKVYSRETQTIPNHFHSLFKLFLLF